MAIYPNLAFAHSSPASAYVEAWTEQVTQSLGVNSLSPPGNAGARSAPLAIPIEEEHGSKQRDETATHGDSPSSPYRPLRRDSLKRREALLKGKEGSRRRQRWENGSCQTRSMAFAS